MLLTMNGRITECVLLSYRTPKHTVEHLLPPGLEPVTRGPYAFWNVVACRVEAMRPAGTPAALGVTYHHVAYRLLAQAMTRTADLHRGLYFVRSDADARLLGVAGNLLTDFHFHPAHIDLVDHDKTLTLTVSRTPQRAGDAELCIDTRLPAQLRDDSCFPTLTDARSVLRDEPMGLAVEGGTLKLAEVLREQAGWHEQPVHVSHARFNFFAAMGQHEVQLELATRIAPIDYRWRLGRREPLLQTPPPRVSKPARPAGAVAVA